MQELPLHQEVPLDHLYDILGEAGLAGLTAAFYRQVQDDDVLRPMYPEGDLAESELRLREFLVFRFGGPPRYLQHRGHPRLRLRHAPFPIDQRARDRWVELMDKAIDEMALPPHVANPLRTFFHDTATFLINQRPPAGS